MNNLGHWVSSWKLHEEWNVVMTTAMMLHAVRTLKTQGTLFLKVRIFNRAETMGLVGILSIAFDNFKLLRVTRQQCTFVVVVATGFTGDEKKRTDVLSALQKGMSQRTSDIFCTSTWLNNAEKITCSLMACEDVRFTMMIEKATRTTIFMCCLVHLKEMLEGKQTRTQCQDSISKTLAPRYGASQLNSDIRDQLMGSIKESRSIERFLFCMNTRWMKDNV